MDDYGRRNYSQISVLKIDYLNTMGDVKHEELSVKQLSLGPFSYLDYQNVFAIFDAVNDAHLRSFQSVLPELPHIDEGRPPICFQIATDYSHIKKTQKTPLFYFGQPLYKSVVKDKMEVAYETFFDRLKNKEIIALDSDFSADDIDLRDREGLLNTICRFENDHRTIAPYQELLKSNKSIFIQQDPDTDWNINSLDVLAVGKDQELRFIHPNDFTKIWHSGQWVDVEWEGLGGIYNGNAEKIPRLH